MFQAYQPFSLQFTTTAFLVTFATLCTVRARLARHAGTLGLQPRRPRWSLLPVAACVIAIPLAGCMRFVRPDLPLYAAAALLILVSFWSLWLPIRAVFGLRALSSYRAAVATALAPSFAITTIVLITLVPFTYLAERHWIARDELGSTSPDNLGMGRLEVEGTRALRTTIQSALDTRP